MLVIAIEGADRVGKQTQARLLRDRFMREDITCALIEVPVNDHVTYDRIYEMLADGRALTCPAQFQALQFANRYGFVIRDMKELALTNDVVLFDRWNASAYAYGSAAGLRADELACLADLVPDVDLTIVLDCDMHRADLVDLDVIENDTCFQRRVRDAYADWASTRSDARCVDASGSPDAVHTAVWRIVQEFLGLEDKFE